MLHNPSTFFTPPEKKFFKFLKSLVKKCSSSPPPEIYLYGGFIRDKLIKKTPKDMDLMISSKILPELIETLKTHFEYLDCKNHILDEFPKKGYNLYSIKLEEPILNLGIVEMKKKICDELKDKDFRMNSLCYDLLRDEFLINRESEFGLEDICRRVIKCNLNARTTFYFSPSRVFRLLRFYVCLGFRIDKRICKYLRFENSFEVRGFYNQSVWSQVRKLVRVLKLFPEKVYRVFKYLYAFKLLGKFEIYADFVKKRIVFLMVSVKNGNSDLIFELIDCRLLEYQDDFLVLNMDLKTLTKIFFLIIAAKNSNPIYLQISQSI